MTRREGPPQAPRREPEGDRSASRGDARTGPSDLKATRALRGALAGYALTAGLCLVVVLGLFVRARNVRAHETMITAAAERVAQLAAAVARQGAARPLEEAGTSPGVVEAYVVSESVVTSKKYPFLKSLRVAAHSEPRRGHKPLADKDVFDVIAAGSRGLAGAPRPGPAVRLRHGPQPRLVAVAPLQAAGRARAAVLVLTPDARPAPLPVTLWIILLGGAVLAALAGRVVPATRHVVVGLLGLGFLAYGLALVRPLGAPTPLPWLIGAAVVVVALAASGVKGYGGRLLGGLAEHRHAASYVGPALLSMALLVLVPFVVGVGMAFFDHRHGSYSFAGVRNFVEILSGGGHKLTDPLNFWFTLVVTLAWTLVNVLFHTTIGLAMALVLRQPWLQLKGIYRVLLIVPWAVPNYITALIWKGMFHQQYGAVNHVLGAFGITPISWFSSFFTSFTANVVTNTWLGFPFMMVIALGALQSIPSDIYEAAEVDGATRWQQFTQLTLPLLRPALFPAITLGCIWTFNQFNIIYLVSRGEPGGSTNILVTEAYRWAFERGERYGLAAAYAVLIFVVLLGLSWVNTRVSRATEGIYE
jgi:ABC-type sugar transport system permease subunit